MRNFILTIILTIILTSSALADVQVNYESQEDGSAVLTFTLSEKAAQRLVVGHRVHRAQGGVRPWEVWLLDILERAVEDAWRGAQDYVRRQREPTESEVLEEVPAR